MKPILKRVLLSLAALFGYFPSGGVTPNRTCDVCTGRDAERTLLEASNNLHMRCPACGRLIRPL